MSPLPCVQHCVHRNVGKKLLWKPDFIVENLKTEDIFSKLESFPGAQGPLLNVWFVLTQCGHFCGVWNFFGWSSPLLTTLSCSLSLKTSRHCEKSGWVKVRHAVVCIRVWKISESDCDFSCFTNTHAQIFLMRIFFKKKNKYVNWRSQRGPFFILQFQNTFINEIESKSSVRHFSIIEPLWNHLHCHHQSFRSSQTRRSIQMSTFAICGYESVYITSLLNTRV